MKTKEIIVSCVAAIGITAALLSAQTSKPVYEQYRQAAARLIGAALEDSAGLDRLAYLCDRIGNRLSGSPALERAIVWAASEMTKAGLENVQTIPVKVPHWVRGQESAALLSPVQRPLFMLGLGDSVGTPPAGIDADLVVVSSFEELARLGREKIAGKIVLYNVPFTSYGKTVAFRSAGASKAAQLGAVAALVRSITPSSLRSPHTGALRYQEGAPKIPAAAVSIEDAETIQRLSDTGNTVRMHLAMEAHMEADAESANVIGELRGSEKPEEIVVIGGHIDSWDVGQGAQDDGSGCMAALEAVSLIRQSGLRPKRTIRVVFWTNEENGTAGAKAYRAWVGDKIGNHVAAIEMDEGAEKPLGFQVLLQGASANAFARLKDLVKPLDAIQAGQIFRGEGETDIEPLMKSGVPGFGVRTVGAHYFDWHHTNADTFDKIDPHDFRLNTAALAVLSYELADMPERLADLH
ncbi:MAG: M20/M25/M40 family metallo-hydrolase [Acidobacteriota bacterium]|nr:M20/M25/M40 family metallo-hydrolase [Acidobacteriota bacterium]